MKREIVKNVYEVGSKHPDRELFDEVIPLPDGTSYNAYLVIGSEKTALIDTVDPDKTDELLDHLESLGIKKLDYVISNHTEQDHSGSIPAVLKKFSKARLITNAKGKELLIEHLHIAEEKFDIIDESSELSLGDRTLKFINTPWVHWPETMSTYLVQDKILFSCDFFGAHLGKKDLFIKDQQKDYISAKRYFAEIMMPFRAAIRGNLKKLENYDIKYIAPSHGPVIDDPKFIIDAYQDWISDETKNEVIICYCSMHGSIKEAVDRLVKKLGNKTKVHLFNLTKTDLGELAINLVDARTIVFATSTFLNGPHPNVANAIVLTNALRPKTKYISVIESFGWGSRTTEIVFEMLGSLNAEKLSCIKFRGKAKANDLEAIDKLADEILSKN